MLKGKSVVITGCLQGIGKGTLRAFAENGANVFACSYKRDEECEAFCKELSKKHGVAVHPVYFDLMDLDAIKLAVREIQSKKTEIHGLVNIGHTKTCWTHSRLISFPRSYFHNIS